MSLRIWRRFVEPVSASAHHTFNGRTLFRIASTPGSLTSALCGPQALSGFRDGEISLRGFGNIDGGAGIGRNVDRKRKPAIGAFLPAGGNEALHGRDRALRKGQAARFRPDIKRGKSAARGLDAGDVFQEKIPRVGSPGVVHFTSAGIETIPNWLCSPPAWDDSGPGRGPQNPRRPHSTPRCKTHRRRNRRCLAFPALRMAARTLDLTASGTRSKRKAHAEASGNISFRSGPGEIVFAVEQVGVDAGFDFLRLPQILVALVCLPQH